MNSKQTVQMILASAAVALVLAPAAAQRGTGVVTTTGRGTTAASTGSLFNYGIGYNYGASGSLMSGTSFTSGSSYYGTTVTPSSGLGFGVTQGNRSNYIASNGAILGSGGARIVSGAGNGGGGGVVVSGSGYFGGYGSPYGYYYGDPSGYGYAPGYGYNYDAFGPVSGYDGGNVIVNGQVVTPNGGVPVGVGTPGNAGSAPYNGQGDGVPMAQTVSGNLQMTREGNGRVRLTWNGDTSLVSRVYLALLDNNKQAISQKLITTAPASARFVRYPRAKYAGVIVDFVDGTRSTTINPLQ